MNFKKRFGFLTHASLTIFALVFSAYAAGEVDLSFNGNLVRARKGMVYRTRIQPDGKILAFGNFNSANGKPSKTLIRLNADGSTDTSFSPPSISGGSILCISAIDLQSDGKIIVAGGFDTIDGVLNFRRGIVRLNPDGSLDPSFLGDPTVASILADVRDLIVLGDNTILLGGPNGFVKLMPDGAVDPALSTANRNTSIERLAIQADGKILNSNSGNLRRFNADGTTEAGFTVATFAGTVYDIAVQADGKILVGGLFNSVNGSALPKLARFNTDGTVDATFMTSYTSGIITQMAVLPDGKIIVYGGINTFQPDQAVRRLFSNGNVDVSFLAPPSSGGWDMDLQADGRIIVPSDATTTPQVLLTRLLSDGSLDNSFQSNLGLNGIGYVIRALSDGKFYAGGLFTHANNIGRNELAKFNADGTTDAGFAPLASPDPEFSNVTAIDVQPDGKVIADLDSSADFNAKRFNTDGSLDVSFPGTSSATAIKVLTNGPIVIGGNLYLKRFNSNGTLDATFSASTNARVLAIAQQADGKIIIAGSFSEVDSTPRGRIARLNSDGSLDTSFNTSTGANSDINAIAIQGDGKVIIAGSFTGVNFEARLYIARLNTDGSLDTSFTSSVDGRLYGVDIQPDGRILTAGVREVSNQTQGQVLRLNSNGSTDSSFLCRADGIVRDVDVLAGGGILIAGEFRSVNGVPRHGLARLLNNAVPLKTLFDYDGDGKSDVSVFRPSENKWYILKSSDGTVSQTIFAIAGDIPVPADYDGDQKTDVAIFRPSNGQWWYQSSINGAQIANTFGASGDIPRPSDFDGDGKADLVLFRPSNSTWLRFGSTAGHVPDTAFGLSGDQPVIGDFDGDGRSDLAIFRPSNGDWWYAASSAGGAFRNVHWGQTGDLPVPADFDGDAKTDIAVFRPSDGGWYIYNSSNGSFTTVAFGTNGDRPVAADYDGDGRADIAIFRPSTSLWYLLRSTSGFTGLQFGISTDTPTPNSFVP